MQSNSWSMKTEELYGKATITKAHRMISSKGEDTLVLFVEQEMNVSLLKRKAKGIELTPFQLAKYGAGKMSKMRASAPFKMEYIGALVDIDIKMDETIENINKEIPAFIAIKESTDPTEVGQTDTWDAMNRLDKDKNQVYVNDMPVYWQTVVAETAYENKFI